RGRVAERDDYAGGRQLLDEGQGAVVLRRQSDQANPTSGSVLQAAELVPIGWPDVRLRMSPARAVFGCGIGPFQMDGGDGAGDIRIALARLPDHSHAVSQGLEAVGHERGTETADTVTPADRDDMADGINGKLWRIEAVAIAAVDLQVEQRRGDPAGLAVRF